jgi:tetratricopeptide (TPR) repeat protein
LNLGSLYAEQGEFKAAEQIYHEALKQDPDNAWAHLYLGNVYYRTGQYDKAVECYQNSIQHNPAYANAYYLLAVSLQKLNRYDEALNASLKYISLEPQGNYAGEMKNMILSLKLQNSSRVQHSK